MSETFDNSYSETPKTKTSKLHFFSKGKSTDNAPPALSTPNMLSYIGTAMNHAWHGDGQQSYHFISGNDQIDIIGTVFEPQYESFDGSVIIRENGRLLFSEDSRNVRAYHNETYTLGKFTSLDDAKEYLESKYAGTKEWKEVENSYPIVDEDLKPVWRNPAYDPTIPVKLERIVFKDNGTREQNGMLYHKIVFAFACDEKEQGKDEPITNPHLINEKFKGHDGKFYVNHNVFLPDDLYKRLKEHTNVEGMEESKWTGIVEAKIGYHTRRRATELSVDLTDEAYKNGRIRKPTTPFNEQKHDEFIKDSLRKKFKGKEEKEKDEKQEKKADPELRNTLNQIFAGKDVGEKGERERNLPEQEFSQNDDFEEK